MAGKNSMFLCLLVHKNLEQFYFFYADNNAKRKRDRERRSRRRRIKYIVMFCSMLYVVIIRRVLGLQENGIFLKYFFNGCHKVY